MAMFYTVNPLGFFNDAGGPVPDGAKPISETAWHDLLTGQSLGQSIQVNASGELYLQDRVVLPAIKIRRLSSLQFLALFTEAERKLVAQSALADPNILQWYMEAMGADYIDLDDPLTRQGLEFLASNNIIAAERVDIILS